MSFISASQLDESLVVHHAQPNPVGLKSKVVRPGDRVVVLQSNTFRVQNIHPIGHKTILVGCPQGSARGLDVNRAFEQLQCDELGSYFVESRLGPWSRLIEFVCFPVKVFRDVAPLNAIGVNHGAALTAIINDAKCKTEYIRAALEGAGPRTNAVTRLHGPDATVNLKLYGGTGNSVTPPEAA